MFQTRPNVFCSLKEQPLKNICESIFNHDKSFFKSKCKKHFLLKIVKIDWFIFSCPFFFHLPSERPIVRIFRWSVELFSTFFFLPSTYYRCEYNHFALSYRLVSYMSAWEVQVFHLINRQWWCVSGAKPFICRLIIGRAMRWKESLESKSDRVH